MTLRLNPLRITLVYALVSLAWIFGSDYLVSAGMHSYLVHTAKGAGFVLLTAGLLYSLTRRMKADFEAQQAKTLESEERFRHLVEHAPDGIFVETGKRFRYVNPAAAKLFGVNDGAALIGQPVLDRIDASLHEAVTQRMRKLGEDRRPVPWLREVYLKVDGTPFDTEVIATPIRYAGEDGALVFFRDITERLRIERENQELQHQLIQAQKQESIGRLAGGIAHDFNNHLQIIHGYSTLLLGDLPLGDPRRSSAEMIQQAAERASALTRQLLTISRKHQPELRPLELNRLLRDLDGMLQHLLSKEIRMELRLDSEPLWVMNDEVWITQVVMNLVVNARDAMPNGGRLLLETCAAVAPESWARTNPEVTPGPCVVLSVADTGTGMSPEVLRHIFEPFFTTKQEGKGTGLGLPVVYGVVRKSNGWITVSSREHSGSAFRIFLPQNAGGETPTRAEFGARGETILLLETRGDLRFLVESILAARGYQVVAAADIAEAVAAADARPGPIHLLLADGEALRLGALPVSRRLRLHHPEMQELWYSDNGALPGVDQDPPHGVEPFSALSLLAAVRQALDGTPHGGAPRPD